MLGHLLDLLLYGLRRLGLRGRYLCRYLLGIGDYLRLGLVLRGMLLCVIDG